MTITYSTGVPAAPTAVAGTPGNGSLALQWAAPSSAGAAPISDYIVQYSSDGGTHVGDRRHRFDGDVGHHLRA